MKQKLRYKRFTRSRVGNVIAFGGLILAGSFTILPLIYSVVTSFKPLEELMIFPPRFFVTRPTIQNYTELPTIISSLSVPLTRYIFNSVFVSVFTTILHILVASSAAFALSKGKFKGLNVIFWLVQFSLLFSTYTLEIPRYLIYSKLGMVDTYLIYILPYLPSTMGVFLIKQFMDGSIPDPLIEAAHIDGANDLQIFWRIVMPNAKPAWLTLCLFAFRDLWSMQPSGTIFSEELKMLPNVMSTISSGGIARSGSAMAAIVILMIPPIIVYLVSQSNVMETMSSAGIK